MSNKIILIVERDLSRNEFKWLRHEFKKGDRIYLFKGRTGNVIGEEGVPCSLDGKHFFELPFFCLSVEYNGEPYKIFINGKDDFYAKSEKGEVVSALNVGSRPWLREIKPDEIPVLF